MAAGRPEDLDTPLSVAYPLGMRIVTAQTSMRGFDTIELQNYDLPLLKRFKVAGYDFCMGYLGKVDAETLKRVFGAGLLFGAICFPPQTQLWIPSAADGKARGIQNVKHMRDLGMPPTACAWIDLEGCGGKPELARDWTNAFAQEFYLSNFHRGLYVGIQTMDAAMLFHGLPRVPRYWRSCSKACVEPDTRGFGLLQLRPGNRTVLGHKVDIDVVEQDGCQGYPEFVGA